MGQQFLNYASFLQAFDTSQDMKSELQTIFKYNISVEYL